MFFLRPLQAEISSHRLLFMVDRDPCVDVGMRQDLLDMIIETYHPLWLKVGLEVCLP